MSFLFPFIGIIIGILGGAAGFSWITGVSIIFFSLIIYLILISSPTIKLKTYSKPWLHNIWITGIFSGIGILLVFSHKPLTLNERQLNQIYMIDGCVNDITHYSSGEKLNINIEKIYSKNKKIYSPRNLSVILFTDGVTLNEGQIIRCPVKLFPVDSFNKKGIEISNNNILETGQIKYASKVTNETLKIIGEKKNIKFLAKDFNRDVSIKIEKSSLNRETSAFIISLLLGDRSMLNEEVKTSFRKSGISHILALSGMHVGIITFMLLGLLFPLRLWGKTKLIYIITIITLWTYAFITGLAPSTLRAVLMTTFLMTGFILQRQKKSINALLCSTVIILIIDPFSIFNIGLQLSFLCVASILIFLKPLNKIDISNHPRTHKLISLILITLITTICTWVLISYYFKEIPLLFLPVNLILLPFLPWFTGLSLIYITGLMLGFDISILSFLLDNIYKIYSYICEYIASLSSSTISYQSDFFIVILWLLGISMLGIYLYKRKKIFFKYLSLVVLGGTLALAFLNYESSDAYWMLEKDNRQIKIVYNDYEKNKIKLLPRNVNSNVNLNNLNIICIDSPEIPDEETINKIIENGKPTILILGSGILKLNLKDLSNLDKFEKIILHPSIGKKKEIKLLEEAAELNAPVYHMRATGNLPLIF